VAIFDRLMKTVANTQTKQMCELILSDIG